jgi:hypothetical protein
MRIHMRRFTRLTNAFSKKFENHVHIVSLYTVWYNFIRIHKTLKTSPAMAAGVSQALWSMEDLCEKMDAVAPKPGPRGALQKEGLKKRNPARALRLSRGSFRPKPYASSDEFRLTSNPCILPDKVSTGH